MITVFPTPKLPGKSTTSATVYPGTFTILLNWNPDSAITFSCDTYCSSYDQNDKEEFKDDIVSKRKIELRAKERELWRLERTGKRKFYRR